MQGDTMAPAWISRDGFTFHQQGGFIAQVDPEEANTLTSVGTKARHGFEW